MPLGRENRRLAAYLLEAGVVSLDALVTAIRRAVAASDEDLGNALTRLGLVAAADLPRLKAEAAGEAQRAIGAIGAFEQDETDGRATSDVARIGSSGENRITDPASGGSGGQPRAEDPRPFAATVRRLEVVRSSGYEAASGGVTYDQAPLPAAADFEIPVERSKDRLDPDGQTLAERYRMQGEIARGGMGRVLRGKDTEIGREVALKVLLKGAQAGQNDVRRFWMEVQATGQLEHPAIIPIHDVGRLPSGELFYVMKLLSGRTLAEVLLALKAGDPASRSEFSRVRLLTIFQQIAYAVAFAHARGVIHRDIKPANIMIGRYGEAMLLDWGLAKLLRRPVNEPRLELPPPEPEPGEPQVSFHSWLSGAETAAGMITGTPQYMAPEATEGHPENVDEKSDVYGLGAVLYEILTWEPAHPDLGFVETIMKVREGRQPPPRQRAPERAISPELEELCLWAMHRDPSRRPSARELADDTGRILEGSRERERRQREARARVAEGQLAVDRWKALRASLAAIEVEAKRLQQDLPPWAEVAKKQPLWSLEDQISALKIDAIGAFEEAEAAFQRALGEQPDDREARGALASLYYARFSEAERARDEEAQRYYKSLVARYDDGAWSKILDGSGTLSVSTTQEPGLTIELSSYQPRGRVLAPVEPRPLGPPPVAPLSLPMGSYRLKLSLPAGTEILRPVLIGRTESVHVHLRVRRPEEIGDGFLLIPAGPCILGGDPIAYGGLEQRVADLREFALARTPVTCEEYLGFLNALVSAGELERARRHVPRVRQGEGYYWNFDPSTGVFQLPQRVEGRLIWAPRYPVFGVSQEDAQAFIDWRRSSSGERLRLPHEDEWEKAARGVDGRFFPWGDHFDPTFCKMKDSRASPHSEPEAVGAFPTDTSPYGVMDMAGGVREICVAYAQDRVVPVMRGGCWHDTALFCRLAFRHVTKPDFVNTGLGFRLAKDLD